MIEIPNSRVPFLFFPLYQTSMFGLWEHGLRYLDPAEKYVYHKEVQYSAMELTGNDVWGGVF